MTYTYCAQFGFDAEGRRRRLALLDLSETDIALGQMLNRRVITPSVEPIIEAFYGELLAQDEFTRILNRGFDLDRLKRTQKLYLLSLGLQFDSAEYFEERLRVGVVHASVSVPLGLYTSAYAILQRLILDHVPPDVKAIEPEYRLLVSFLLKVTALDMSLASDIYYLAKVQGLESSLQAWRHAGKELRHKVETDTLTGAASHSQAIAMLQRALRIAQRNDTPLCIDMVDLDFFKNVNDSYGHLVGDEVLRDVTARMRSSVRDFDIVGRYGGEEFVIILENAPLATAKSIAERVRRHVAQSPIKVKDLRIPLTLSQGVAAAHKADDVASLLKRADTALYAAKAAGRNCVKLAEVDCAVE